MMWSAGMHQLQLVLCHYIFYDRSGGNSLVNIRYKYVLYMYRSVPGKCPPLGKCPRIEFPGVTVVASIQVYAVYNPG